MRREFFDLWLAKYLKPQGWRGREVRARRMQAKALADLARNEAAIQRGSTSEALSPNPGAQQR